MGWLVKIGGVVGVDNTGENILSYIEKQLTQEGISWNYSNE